jgi:hypothetical protein
MCSALGAFFLSRLGLSNFLGSLSSISTSSPHNEHLINTNPIADLGYVQFGKCELNRPGFAKRRMILARPIFSVKHFCARKTLVVLGRISDLLKFLVPKVGESFVLDHNVESQEVAQARPRPELAGALETILELAAL